jgi:hypothetical protein
MIQYSISNNKYNKSTMTESNHLEISLYITSIGFILFIMTSVIGVVLYSVQLDIRPDDGSIITSCVGYMMLLSVILMFEGFKHICIILVMYAISYIFSIPLKCLYYVLVYIKNTQHKKITKVIEPEDMV